MSLSHLPGGSGAQDADVVWGCLGLIIAGLLFLVATGNADIALAGAGFLLLLFGAAWLWPFKGHDQAN
jgi:membrane-bound ClpP family serine protease